MTKPTTFRQADVERALRAAENVGLRVARATISPNTGEISLEFEGVVANSNSRRLLDKLHAA